MVTSWFPMYFQLFYNTSGSGGNETRSLFGSSVIFLSNAVWVLQIIALLSLLKQYIKIEFYTLFDNGENTRFSTIQLPLLSTNWFTPKYNHNFLNLVMQCI